MIKIILKTTLAATLLLQQWSSGYSCPFASSNTKGTNFKSNENNNFPLNEMHTEISKAEDSAIIERMTNYLRTASVSLDTPSEHRLEYVNHRFRRDDDDFSDDDDDDDSNNVISPYSSVPTVVPTKKAFPTKGPIASPSVRPSNVPSIATTKAPTTPPSKKPTVSFQPTRTPSSAVPTRGPSIPPTFNLPTISPSKSLPTKRPTPAPQTITPTVESSAPPTAVPSLLTTSAFTPGICALTSGRPVFSTHRDICNAYNDLNAALDATLPADRAGRSAIFGKGLRLSWHDAAEFDLNTSDQLGPDGCLSQSPDNAGLIEEDSLVNTFIEPLWQSMCDRINRADFWALFGKRVVEIGEPTGAIKLPYYYGRRTNTQCDSGAGRLPKAQPGYSEFHRVFEGQLGLTVFDAAALLGAHTFGHVHQNASGYGIDGLDPNSNVTANAFDVTPDVFDNEYFRTAFTFGWKSHAQLAANHSHWEFGRVPQLLLLNADLALGFPLDSLPPSFGVSTAGQACGPASVKTAPCSALSPCYGCTATINRAVNRTHPLTYETVIKYAQNNSAFLEDFGISYTKILTIGYSLNCEAGNSFPRSAYKLGKLKSFDVSKCSYHGPEVGIDPSNGGASNHNEVSADDVTDNGSSYFNSK